MPGTYLLSYDACHMLTDPFKREQVNDSLLASPRGLRATTWALQRGTPAEEDGCPLSFAQPGEVRVLLEEAVAEAAESRRFQQETLSNQGRARAVAEEVCLLTK